MRSCETRSCASYVWSAKRHHRSPRRCARLGDVPWREIRGFRNIAIHAYFTIDWETVHEAATVSLPDMEPKVLGLLQVEGPDIAARFDAEDGADETGMAGEAETQTGTAEASDICMAGRDSPCAARKSVASKRESGRRPETARVSALQEGASPAPRRVRWRGLQGIDRLPVYSQVRGAVRRPRSDKDQRHPARAGPAAHADA